MDMDELFITNAIAPDVLRLAQNNLIGHALKGLLETIPCESLFANDVLSVAKWRERVERVLPNE